MRSLAAKVVSVLVGDFKACVLAQGRFRLVAATEIWQAGDRCRRYQTLICYLTRRPLRTEAV